jgi:anaerobic sulfite reductase subunit B
MTTISIDAAPAMSPLLIPRPYRVLDKVREVADTWTLHVTPVDGSLPEFEPAQVSMLGAFGVGEAAISISSATDQTDHHAYTIRAAGPITHALTDTPIGGVITVRGPFGNQWPLADVDTNQLAIIAGGLGIAPLRAAVHSVVAQLERFDRVGVAYGAKTPDDLIYVDDLERWRDCGVEVALTVDRPNGEWIGSVGVVADLLGADPGLDFDWTDTTVFLCGPDVMMHFTAAALLRLGVTADRIWMTLERNMQCGNGLCGHCQLGPVIVCRDGPVISYARVGPFHQIREL